MIGWSFLIGFIVGSITTAFVIAFLIGSDRGEDLKIKEEEKIEEFKKQFNMADKYPAKTFFDWHNKLTGSCLFGRQQFVNENDINLDVDMFTVAEFVELTKNSYGGDVIRKITEE